MAGGNATTWSTRIRSLEILLHLPSLVRLHWRLLRDARVSIWPKALLAAALAYVALPFDFIPDALPFLGQVDDLVIVIVAARWFLQLCPPDVVREHAQAIDRHRRA
jgi:uncharacterized membrane protein YkvA (DUF1232 family)